MQSIRTTFRSLSRSAVIVGTVLALGIAGCSTASDEATSTSDDVAVGGRLFSTADSATAALGSDAEPGQFPRTVVHSRGETTLEQQPQRVVVLDSGEIDQVLSLGVTPVASPARKTPPASPLTSKISWQMYKLWAPRVSSISKPSPPSSLT